MMRSTPSAARAALGQPLATRRRRAPAAIEAVMAVDAVGDMVYGLDGAREVPDSSYVDLYWLPLGAGGHSVRVNGLVYEAVVARLGARERCDLYHSALEIRDGQDRYVIEMAPVWSERAGDRGVVGEGPVGSRWLGRLRAFRYEIRCWRGGRIPDVADAVESPQCLTEDRAVARRVLELVPTIPRLVWGRDEAHAADMWNSNSMTAWLLVRSGVDLRLAQVPAGGRAPGWDAGVALARRATVACPGEQRGAGRARTSLPTADGGT